MGRTGLLVVTVSLAVVLVVGGALVVWAGVAQQRELRELRTERADLAEELHDLRQRLEAEPAGDGS